MTNEQAAVDLDQAPFAAGDRAAYLDFSFAGMNFPGRRLVVGDCERATDLARVRWIVTDTEGDRHFADKLRKIADDEKPAPDPKMRAIELLSAVEDRNRLVRKLLKGNGELLPTDIDYPLLCAIVQGVES